MKTVTTLFWWICFKDLHYLILMRINKLVLGWLIWNFEAEMLIIPLNYSDKRMIKVTFKIFEYWFSLQYYEKQYQNHGWCNNIYNTIFQIARVLEAILKVWGKTKFPEEEYTIFTSHKTPEIIWVKYQACCYSAIWKHQSAILEKVFGKKEKN